MPDFVQTAPYDPSARGIARGMVYKFSARHDFLWIAWRGFRWLVLHPISLAGIILGGWLWTLGLGFWWALLLGSLPHFGSMGWGLGRLVAVALRRHSIHLLPRLSNKHTDTPSLLSMWWRIHRGWTTGVRKSGFLQPGRGGQIPNLRHWELTNSGISAWVACGKFGWTADELATRAETIAAGIKRCRGVTVTQGQFPGVARVDFAFSDPLGETLSVAELAAPPKSRLTCGITERGDPAHLHNYLSTLVVGLPGSGKSNMLWTLILSALASGEPFELWVLDPAGGVELWELSNGSPIVKKYAATPGQMKELVHELHTAMIARMNAMAGKERLHIPTKEAPRWYLVIDELMRAHNQLDKNGGKGPNYRQMLVEILSLGRKAAITTIALTQIPFGHAIGEQVRILFPQKVVFRSNDWLVTNTAFGSGSEALGAAASKISIRTPGVGFMVLDTDTRPVRFRSPYISDFMTSLIAKGILPDGVPSVEGYQAERENRPQAIYRWDTPPEGIELKGIPGYEDGTVYIGLLYVGISVDAFTRFLQHMNNVQKALFMNEGVQSTVIKVLRPENCVAALEAGRTIKDEAESHEKALIKELNPLLNIAHNGRRKALPRRSGNGRA